MVFAFNNIIYEKVIMAAPFKPHRKKILEQVPIHKDKIYDDLKNASEEHHQHHNKKTFSANFNSKRTHQKQSPKSKHYYNNEPIKNELTETVSQKISRKYLYKENQRLLRENEDIVIKFNELEELSVRKIMKLKEKILTLQNLNEEITNDNNVIKGHSQELLQILDDLKLQLELSKQCKNCEGYKATLEKFGNENNHLKLIRKELEEDVNMLKTVVYRLNLQMERYQDKLRNLNVKPSQFQGLGINQSNENMTTIDAGLLPDVPFLSEHHQDHSHTPISWGKVNMHTLGPLLDAYQDTLNEKEEIIQNYEAELSNFTGKLKEIIKENEQFYRNLNEDKNSSIKLKQELNELKSELSGLKDQNDILIKKCALKQDKLEEVIKCYDSKVEQLKRDYSVVHEQYCKSRTEVAALREKNKALVDSQDDFKSERQSYIPISVHTSSVNECKKWYEELKLQYEHEKNKMNENCASQTKLIDELKSKLSSCGVAKDELENKIKQLEKHIKKSEAKYIELEHSLSEVQFSRSACRKQLNKAMNFAKDLVNEQETLLKALNQRQQENKVVKKIGSDIAIRMDSLRNQLKDVQRDAWNELSTVEKRIQDQQEAMETMKEEHSSEIERLQHIIKEQQESNLLLKEQTTLPTPHYLLYRDKHK